jgi:hypothetical protein
MAERTRRRRHRRSDMRPQTASDSESHSAEEEEEDEGAVAASSLPSSSSSSSVNGWQLLPSGVYTASVQVCTANDRAHRRPGTEERERDQREGTERL